MGKTSEAIATAALFERIQPEGALEEWVPGQAYAKGVRVLRNGMAYESMVDNNTWEPGGPGIDDRIWKVTA